MKEIRLLLGSNLGDRASYIATAREHISRYIGHITSTTEVVETEAWPQSDDPAYLNQVIAVETIMSPEVCIRNIMTIERLLGRVRGEANAPRTIDIDILTWDGLDVQNQILTLPHPAIGTRTYVDDLLKKL